jgi:hypothetical protein
MGWVRQNHRRRRHARVFTFQNLDPFQNLLGPLREGPTPDDESRAFSAHASISQNLLLCPVLHNVSRVQAGFYFGDFDNAVDLHEEGEEKKPLGTAPVATYSQTHSDSKWLPNSNSGWKEDDDRDAISRPSFPQKHDWLRRREKTRHWKKVLAVFASFVVNWGLLKRSNQSEADDISVSLRRLRIRDQINYIRSEEPIFLTKVDKQDYG